MNHNQVNIDVEDLTKEVRFKMSTSSGNGGQNVNRVATKATLYFSIFASELFSDLQKEILSQKLGNRTNKEGEVVIVNQETRSALKNKKRAVKLLEELIVKALTPKKKRKKTKISAADNEKRLAAKKRKSEVKAMRKVDNYF